MENDNSINEVKAEVNNPQTQENPINNYNSYQENKASNFTKPKNTNPKKSSRIFVPFISGMLGACLVMGVCFGVPSIKNKIMFSEPILAEEGEEGNSEVATRKFIDLEDYSKTSTSVAEKVLPSVVGISITYNVNTFFGSSTATATGSGIIISEDGYIVTNNHVISSSSSNSFYQITEASGIKISLYNDDTEYEAQIIGSDSYSDLAVLKIDKTGLKAATIGDSNEVQVGEFAMAVGNPLGMDSTVTCGVVSAVNRTVSDDEGNSYIAIQTDAAINQGNSGGALVNAKGEVIGINTLKLSGTGVEGIGFAIPISSTTEIVEQLKEFKEVKRPYIGIIGTSVTDSAAQEFGFQKGVYIREVAEDSPAAKADLKVSDIITHINGTKVKTIDELNAVKNKCKIGDTVELTIIRNGEEQKVSVVLGETPAVTEEETPTNTTTTPEPKQETPERKESSPSIWDYFNFNY